MMIASKFTLKGFLTLTIDEKVTLVYFSVIFMIGAESPSDESETVTF
jgi:hypothetical protein